MTIESNFDKQIKVVVYHIIQIDLIVPDQLLDIFVLKYVHLLENWEYVHGFEIHHFENVDSNQVDLHMVTNRLVGAHNVGQVLLVNPVEAILRRLDGRTIFIHAREVNPSHENTVFPKDK